MHQATYKKVKLTLWVILFVNFLVALIKIGIGLTGKSQGVTADGLHSLADGASNIVGLVGIWFASRPADEKHPYGYGKFEVIASLFIGLLLGLMSLRIMTGAVVSLQSPPVFEINLLQAVLIVITIFINITVAITEYRLGKKLKSTILVTDSLHTRGDILISCVVLLSLLLIKCGVPAWIDAVMSILVALAVLLSAWHIIKDCVNVLTDCAAVNSRELQILLRPALGTCELSRIRSRGDLNHIMIDLEVVVPTKETLQSTQELAQKIEALLKERFGEDTEVVVVFCSIIGYSKDKNTFEERNSYAE